MNEKFDEFQLEEYRNISNAHFETNKQIGVFFRYFLLIVSAPSIIFLWLGKYDLEFVRNLLNGNKDQIYTNLFIGCFIIIVAIIGAFSAAYLISLKLDSVLYARTINCVRNYFYRNGIDYEDSFRILPKQKNIPKYHDFHTFGVLFYAIALINSIYFSLGLRIIAAVGNDIFPYKLINNFDFIFSILTLIFVFVFHILYYIFIAKYRRLSYLKSKIIGIDIDGVLNNHTVTFCNLYNENQKEFCKGNITKLNELSPEEITQIPVSQIRNKEIDKKDEYDVFNNPKYWYSQILKEDNIPTIINELKNIYGYEIRIHSYRPWPQYYMGKYLNDDDILKYWKIIFIKLKIKRNLQFDGKTKESPLYIKIKLWQKIKLSKITKQWLKFNNIEFDRLFIEKNGINRANRSLSIWEIIFNRSNHTLKNRFNHSSVQPYRYFIEDDIENAIKLSVNCEYVFLIKQPYNQNYEKDLPNNIIRVENWSDIKNKIKSLG